MMNLLKRILGVIWVAAGLLAVYYLIVNQALDMFKQGGEKLVPAIIYTCVLCPIVAGTMITFGWFALQGKYDK